MQQCLKKLHRSYWTSSLFLNSSDGVDRCWHNIVIHQTYINGKEIISGNKIENMGFYFSFSYWYLYFFWVKYCLLWRKNLVIHVRNAKLNFLIFFFLLVVVWLGYIRIPEMLFSVWYECLDMMLLFTHRGKVAK